MTRPVVAHADSSNLYAVLALPVSSASLTQADIRRAYRLALLTHHPDKRHPTSTTTHAKPVFTVDEITRAYTTLSSPVERSAYDATLRPAAAAKNLAVQTTTTTTELDTVDLSDMIPDASAPRWTRECRCGNRAGYTLEEEVLLSTEANGEGEVWVGCEGCSHHIRVVYSIEVEE